MQALERLLHLPVFADVSEDDRRELLEVASVRDLAQDEILMQAGESGDDLAVVLTGGFTVEIGDGEQVLPLAWVSSGEILGETALFRRQSVRSARVRASEPSQVLHLETSDLEALTGRGSGVPRAIEEAVLRTLARRVHDSVEAIDGVLSTHRTESAPSKGPLARLMELLRR